MNDKNDSRTKLIADLFHGDWSDGTAGDYPRKAAGHARRHRARRQAAWGIGTTACLVALFTFTWVHENTKKSPVHASLDKPPAYEIISDDELLAELHDRPLLLVHKENGERQLVMLDN